MEAPAQEGGATRRRYSVAKIADHWYVACRSKDLGPRPLAVSIFDTPLVLFRHEGGAPTALLDRCAHRNVPLSIGRVEDCRLVCAYHGWAYDGGGVCQKVPALAGVQIGKGRRVPAYPTLEQQGLVWVFLDPDKTPAVAPYALPLLDDERYTTVRYAGEVEATLHATLENILDVPHTAFLHRGLFRGVRQNEITAVVKRSGGQVEAQYLGEPRPTGLIGGVLAPGGGTVEHYDRFMLPSIAQVEYRLGEKNHIVVTSLLTPVSDFKTKLHAAITFRTAIPSLLIRPFLMPLALKVFEQDRVMLKRQTDTVQRFGGEQYVSTDVDLLGPHIWRLLREAERGEPPSTEPFEERVQLLA